MQIQGATAFVTGANRGLGRHIAQQLRDRGANVYAAARDLRSVDLEGVIPLTLDITDQSSVAAAAATAQDVSILVNNAGVATGAGLLAGDLDQIRLEFDTNFFGTLSVTRAFASQLGRHQQSSVLNVLSVLSWFSLPSLGGYSASKSAQWSLTNGIRQELARQGTTVAGLHVGFMDTDLAAGIDGPKLDPADIARTAVDAIESGETEILGDQLSESVRAGLAGGVSALYPEFS
ncbi:SDR family oxidoreductase [Arthrobacter globiformis]|uniref:SDR family oxidoreductase n=1 Tax=Arthrobacter globiformis TaxID=1665 RepID=UPI0027822F49|nr:SDR family oxidoreductase [Arthrobacter globiformis]MDQ0867527.1 NAD(P)-dependent dehydrogenase (short-subunit alcohol dehydrogenase family) [Arthrobacter globiformis]